MVPRKYLMKCPECGHDTYTSRGGYEICPNCGYGSPTVAERRRKFEEYKRSLIEGPADRLYSKGAWKLKIVYEGRGTKKERPHGVLYKDGEMVNPLQPGEMIETDLGTLKYYAHLTEMQPFWAVTGWHFADQTLILSSFGDRILYI
jgi:hypothetical protein